MRGAVVVSLVVAIFAVFRAGAVQAAFADAVAADVVNAIGIFAPYRPAETRDTPPPPGFDAFYVSHYGRHGCRYLASELNLLAAEKMELAAGKGLLTDVGRELLARLRKIHDANEGMIGELTVRGATEHRGIARRMLARFPQVFARGGKVRCQSSVFSRCIMSMANFACEMKGGAAWLSFEFATGRRLMAALANTVEESKLPNAEVVAAKSRLLHGGFDPSALVARLFCGDADAVRDVVGDAHKFAESLFYMMAVCRPLDVELGGLRIDDVFTPDELLSLSRVMNSKWYMLMGDSEEFGDGRLAATRNLAGDIVRRADEALECGSVAADLRFGHDGALWPLLALVGIEGAGDRTSYMRVCDHEMLWRSMTMGSNLQLAFYRNASGETLVKVLYNEREMRVRGLEQVAGAFYRWKDLRGRLAQAR